LYGPVVILPVAMTEPRCGLVHMQSGCLLAKTSRGDCRAEMSEKQLTDEDALSHFKRSPFEFKLQVAEATEDGEPRVLWIRIGVHPQRCLCVSPESEVRLEQWMSPAAPEPKWRIHFLEATGSAVDEATNGDEFDVTDSSDGITGDADQMKAADFPALCFLQNVKTGKFLSMQHGVPVLQPEGDMWGIVKLRGAATPGKVLRRSLLVGGGGVAVASVGAAGVAGAAAVGATVRTAGSAATAGAAVKGTAAAVSGAVHAMSVMSVGKAVAAAAALPGAVMATMGNATAAAGAGLAAFQVVQYAVVGIGAGAAVAKVGAVACSTAALVNHARDPGLYVHGYPFVPKPLMRSLSQLSQSAADSD